MPIRACRLPSGENGFQWGASGKCYATRAEAAKQAEAAYANGCAGDETLTIALDRTVRTRDVDGRLHIELTNISKANVCPYYGREIPGGSALGLDPDRVYQLLRHPQELADGASTFNNVPLLDEHIIVSASNPQKDNVVGSTGTDAEFNGEYLRNSLVIWDAEAIARIESGEQKQISCAYRYKPDMTAGNYRGLPYDGIMRNIQANHVALVREGRAGPDVVVADGKIGDANMPVKSKRALMVRGAIAAALAPMALDAKPDFAKVLDGVNAKTFPTLKSAIVERVSAGVKLAADQKASLAMALDAMEEEEVEGEDEEPDVEKGEKGSTEAGKDKAKDEDPKAEDEDDDDKKKPGEDAKAYDARMKRARDKAAKDKAAKDEEESDKEKAMDAKIQAGIATGVSAGIARLEAVAKAKEDVLPYIGAIVGMDSASDIYKLALDAAAVDTKGVDASAFAAMLKLLPKPNTDQPRVAMDAASRGGAAKMFPQLAHIGRA